MAKFGGTSVRNADCWRAIRRVVDGHLAAGYRSLVVCSAVAGVTNTLEHLLKTAARGGDPGEALAAIDARHRELAGELGLDADEVTGDLLASLAKRAGALAARAHVSAAAHAEVMAHGELLSTRLGAAWLGDRGARWCDARALLRAEPPASGSSPAQRYLAATCRVGPDPELRQRLAEAGPVVVTQGFIASDAAGATVLLGRGGSDTSAAYLASKLSAARLEVWTDVPGMFTANPSAVPQARLVPSLTYAEAQSLAGLGARVLHPRCLGAVQGQNIPLRLGATGRPNHGGTTINGFEPRPAIRAIASRNGLCLVSMRRPAEWQPVGFMADVASCFARLGLSMDLLSSSPGEIRATIDTTAFPDTLTRLDAILAELGHVCDAEATASVASVSLVGHRLSEDEARYRGAARVLHEQKALLISHAADDSSLTCVVEREAAAELERRLHAELFERDASAQHDDLGPTWRELSRAPARRPGSAAVAAG